MPQVQVLPYVPTFGERLGPVLSEAGSQAAKYVEMRNARTALDQILNPKSAAKSNEPKTIDQQGAQQNGDQSAGSNEPKRPDGLNVNKILQVSALAKKAYPDDPNSQKALTASLIEQEKLDYKTAEKKAEKEVPKFDQIQADIISGNESAQISKANLNKIEALNKNGQLAGQLPSFLSQQTGIPVELWAGADTEEFNKLIAQRGLQVGKAYGFGRILEKEFTEFLRTIPSLMNSAEGRDRIINSLRYFDNLALSRYKNFKELRGKYDNAGDLQYEMSKRMEPEFERFGEVLQYGDELVEVESPSGEKGKVPRNQLDLAKSQKYKVVGNK